MTNAEILFEVLRFIPQSFAITIVLDFVGFLADSPLDYKSKKTWLTLFSCYCIYTVLFIFITYFFEQTTFIYALRIVMTLAFFSICSLIFFRGNRRVILGSVVIAFLAFILSAYLMDLFLYLLITSFPSLAPIFNVFSIEYDTIFVIVFVYNGLADLFHLLFLFVLKKFKAELISFFFKINFLFLLFLFALVSLLMTLNLQVSYVQTSGTLNLVDLFFSIIIMFLSASLFNTMKIKGNLILTTQEKAQTISYINSLEEILNEKKETQHDYKNQLLILQSFFKEKKYIEAENYLSYIFPIENTDFQFKNLNILPAGGLKGLIYIKLYDLRKTDIIIDVLLGKKITFLDQLTLGNDCYYDLCKIIGILLDNAIEGCTSSDKKEILFEIYEKENTCYISITNTYTGIIYPSLINQYGYSTKGKGRGYGLYIVNKLLKKHKGLSLKTSLDDLFFTQTVEIKKTTKNR